VDDDRAESKTRPVAIVWGSENAKGEAEKGVKGMVGEVSVKEVL